MVNLHVMKNMLLIHPQLIILLFVNIYDVSAFRVHDFAIFSDHCPTETLVKMDKSQSNFYMKQPQSDNDVSLLEVLPDQLIWDKELPSSFINSLNSQKVRSLIDDFTNKSYVSDIESAVGDFNNILKQASLLSLKTNRIENRRHKRKSSKTKKTTNIIKK